MTFTYDVTTDRGKVRLLISDTDDTAEVFNDAEIDAFLTMESNSVLRAAAMALDAIAGNEAQVLKVIDTLDLKTDGAKLAAEMRAQARQLRERADELDEDESGDQFAVVEWADPVFAYRERFGKQWLIDGA